MVGMGNTKDLVSLFETEKYSSFSPSSGSSFSLHLFSKKAYGASPFDMKKIRAALESRTWSHILVAGMVVRGREDKVFPDGIFRLVKKNGVVAWDIERIEKGGVIGNKKLHHIPVHNFEPLKEKDLWAVLKPGMEVDTHFDKKIIRMKLIEENKKLSPDNHPVWHTSVSYGSKKKNSWSSEYFRRISGVDYGSLFKKDLDARGVKYSSGFSANIELPTKLTLRNLYLDDYNASIFEGAEDTPAIFYRGGKSLLPDNDGNYWFTSSEFVAYQYSEDFNSPSYEKVSSMVAISEKPFLLKTFHSGSLSPLKNEVAKNFKKIGMKLNDWHINDVDMKIKAIKYAKENGYDSVIFDDSSIDGRTGMESLVLFDDKNIVYIKIGEEVDKPKNYQVIGDYSPKTKGANVLFSKKAYSGRVFPTVLQGIGDAIPFFGTKNRYGSSPFDMKKIRAALESSKKKWWQDLKPGMKIKVRNRIVADELHKYLLNYAPDWIYSNLGGKLVTLVKKMPKKKGGKDWVDMDSEVSEYWLIKTESEEPRAGDWLWSTRLFEPLDEEDFWMLMDNGTKVQVKMLDSPETFAKERDANGKRLPKKPQNWGKKKSWQERNPLFLPNTAHAAEYGTVATLKIKEWDGEYVWWKMEGNDLLWPPEWLGRSGYKTYKSIWKKDLKMKGMTFV